VLIVVSGPSGAGKGTVVQGLLRRDPSLWLSVSATTRAPRPGEVDGRDYRFVSVDEFRRMVAAGGFIEWFEVYGDLKGTPRGPVEERLARGEDVVLEIDTQGALAIRERYPDAVLVFIRPPSRDAQRRRMLERGADDAASVERRLSQAADEEAVAARAFDHIVVNDEVDRAVDELAAILERRRAASV
jgi:guanylate kinase